MKENEPDPMERLYNHYLEEDQLHYLFEKYWDAYKAIYDANIDSVELPELFKRELYFWWAAYAIESTPFYNHFVKSMLIPAEYVYYFRDYFINYVNGTFKKG